MAKEEHQVDGPNASQGQTKVYHVFLFALFMIVAVPSTGPLLFFSFGGNKND